MNVTIITPMSRPNNFFEIYDSLVEYVKPFINYKWFVAADFDSIKEFENSMSVDTRNRFMTYILANIGLSNTVIHFLKTNENGLSGNPQRNIALDREVDADFIYFLDDDNIVHPNLFRTVAPLLKEKAIVVNQVFKTGARRLWADRSQMFVGGIDTAQLVLPRKMIGDTRWEPWNYCADGVFFSSIYRDNPHDFEFINLDLAYYNYLR